MYLRYVNEDVKPTTFEEVFYMETKRKVNKSDFSDLLQFNNASLGVVTGSLYGGYFK